jgi:aerobic-type carbon monoxide dehydrogenase small subunit (CoxS/CutS family)
VLLKINDLSLEVPIDWQDESLLNLLRELFGLVGNKFGCGAGVCGACTVRVDGAWVWLEPCTPHNKLGSIWRLRSTATVRPARS